MLDRGVIVDHSARAVRVAFVLEPGPKAEFGETVFEGLRTVDEEFVRNRMPWETGDPYDAELLQTFQGRLVSSRLFGSVRIVPGEALDKDHRLPISVRVTERKHRTVKTGASYKTDEGLGASASWEHRNFLDRGEQMRFELAWSEIFYGGEARFSKPSFLRRNQSLLLSLQLAEDSPDAYKSRHLRAEGLLEREFTTEMTGAAGLAFKTSKVLDAEGEERFQYVTVPLRFNWNATDDLLDPTRGGRLSLKCEPFVGVSAGDKDFVRAWAQYRRYRKVHDSPPGILAGRMTLGLIAGADREEVPADERYYAGGGGSIRGYAYQSVGPHRGKEPVGGRSLFEVSVEYRIKVTDALGLVAFMDGGNVFEPVYPNFDDSLRWGAGIGFRYYTRVGPFRMDIGFPLNRRSHMDDDTFQIYLSLGQAF